MRRSTFIFDDCINKKFGAWTVIDIFKPRKSDNRRDTYFRCRCDCGAEREIKAYLITNGYTLKCRECESNSRIVIKNGDKYNKWTVMSEMKQYTTRTTYVYICKCECGKIGVISRQNLRDNKSKSCKECASKLFKYSIGNTLWNILLKNARERGLTVSIDWGQAVKLLEKQNYKCALSGQDIHISECLKEHNRGKTTASLDRVNSNKGYIKGNIQWVHKDINIMKNAFPQDKFITWCKYIANHNKSKKTGYR